MFVPCGPLVHPSCRLLMLVGGYGSGKTEVAVNLALALARAGRRVQVADLDLVNPYFRSREARALLEAQGIRVVVPPGAQAFADLPIVLPEIRGMLRPPEGTLSLFDVGGDDVGAKALASLASSIGAAPYELWQVVNARRPFTRDVDGCLAMRADLERASRLAVTGLVANSHLIEHTTPEVVLEGLALAREAAVRMGVPVRLLAAMAPLLASRALADPGVPVLALERHMRPPWVPGPPPRGERLPAARAVPLGVARTPVAPPRPGEKRGSHRD